MALNSKEDDDSIPLDPQTVLVLMFLMALFLPAALMLYIYPLAHEWWDILAMTWQFGYHGLGSEFYAIIFPLFFFPILVYFAFRLVFAYQVYRFYIRQTTRRRTLLVGIVSELQPLMFSIGLTFFTAMMVGGWGGSYTIQTPLPIPILFIAGYYFINSNPIEEITTPWKKPERKSDDKPQINPEDTRKKMAIS